MMRRKDSRGKTYLLNVIILAPLQFLAELLPNLLHRQLVVRVDEAAQPYHVKLASVSFAHVVQDRFDKLLLLLATP